MAFDLLTNFEQRWRKQVFQRFHLAASTSPLPATVTCDRVCGTEDSRQLLCSCRHAGIADGMQAADAADQLLDLQGVPGLAVPKDRDNPDDPAVFAVPEDDDEEWVAQVPLCCHQQRHDFPDATLACLSACSLDTRWLTAIPQLFRSMDSESAVGYPDDNAAAYRLGLQTSTPRAVVSPEPQSIDGQHSGLGALCRFEWHCCRHLYPTCVHSRDPASPAVPVRRKSVRCGRCRT